MKLHCWIRSKEAHKSRDWPNGFWKGDKAVGLALKRLNLMLTWR